MRSLSSTLKNAAVFGVFFLAALLLVQGLKLDTLQSTFETHWQFLDLPELAKAPFQSFLQLHAQPPLLNMITWLLMLPPGDLYHHFIVLNAACIALTGFILFAIAGVYLKSRIAAFVIAAVYVVAPVTLLYIAYPFYPCLTTAGYAVLVYAFLIVKERPNYSLALFVLAITYLALLRSSFSLLHSLFFCGIYFIYARNLIPKLRMIAALAAAVGMALVVPVKNYALYGFFGSSSWAPLNLAQGFAIPSPIYYFTTPAQLKELYPEMQCRHSYGWQDTALTKHCGEPNMNSCYILEHANLVRSQMWAGYRLKPHALAIKKYIRRYFSTPDYYAFLTNRRAIAFYADLSHIAYVTVNLPSGGDIRLLTLAILAVGLLTAAITREKFLCLCLVVIISHFFTHVLTDGQESRRFVFDIEFLFYALLVMTISALNKRWRRQAG